LRRAAQALRDPWSLVAVGIGAGTAWALAFPAVGIGAVGLGMLGVAAAVGAATSGGDDKLSGSPPVPVLRAGTAQFELVRILESYLADLTRLQTGPLPAMLTAQAADAVGAARSARIVALDVAASVDALDGALHEAGQVARQMSTKEKVSGPLDRMVGRRRDLLAKLTAAVDGVGELYTKLLELSTTPELTSGLAIGPDPVAEVNDSLDAIRGAFAELDSAARSTSNSLNAPRSG
jgi:hypothetical protein